MSFQSQDHVYCITIQHLMLITSLLYILIILFKQMELTTGLP